MKFEKEKKNWSEGPAPIPSGVNENLFFFWFYISHSFYIVIQQLDTRLVEKEREDTRCKLLRRIIFRLCQCQSEKIREEEEDALTAAVGCDAFHLHPSSRRNSLSFEPSTTVRPTTV